MYWLDEGHPCVPVSCGCYNKLPQTGQLKTSEIYRLTVLQTRSLKSMPLGWNQGVHKATLSPGQNLGETCPLSFLVLWWVLAFPGLWLHHSHLSLSCHISLSSSMSLFFSLLSRHLWCRHGEQTCGCQGARGAVGGMDRESGISRASCYVENG